MASIVRSAPRAPEAPFGDRVLRREDRLLVTGEGQFVGDMDVENALHMKLVPAALAHAVIAGIETETARTMPGVRAVVTHADVGVPSLPPWLPDVNQGMTRALLAHDRVRFVGEPVAAVVAETETQAADAVPTVVVSYEELPPVVELDHAYSDEVLLFPQVGTNTCFHLPSEPLDPDLFADCEVKINLEMRHQRIAACPIEPRAGIAKWDDQTGLTYWAAAAEPHGMRERLAQVLEIDEDLVRVICGQVGGAFGAKGGDYLEEMLVAVLARKFGRPVKWTEARSDSMIGMYHGRALEQKIELGGSRDGTILAYRIDVTQDAGAYPTWAAMLTTRSRVLASGAYAVPRIATSGRAVVTTRTPVGTVRGAGRPEANIAIERAIDLFARQIDMDPVRVRAKNVIAPEAFPYTTASGSVYDSGNYPELLRRIVSDGKYKELRREQARRRAVHDSVELGIGVALFVEVSDTAPVGEYTELEITSSGRAVLRTGAAPHGQGHATTLAQIVSGVLRLPMSRVDVRHGDTAEIPRGVGSFGSRTGQAAGSATFRASHELLAHARELAAEALDEDEEGIRVIAEGFVGADGAAVTWSELVRRVQSDGGRLAVEHQHDGKQSSAWPSGAVLAAVEVDTETGETTVRSLVTCDDVGVVINPLIAEGQVQGGLALGVAHALLEEFRYDDHGTPLTANFGQYGVITADRAPRAALGHIETRAPGNDIGAKGVGETGTVGCPAAILNAVADALRPLGVRHIDPPATPERIHAAITDARTARTERASGPE